MPVILPDEAYDLWLEPGLQKSELICDLLQPYDANLMQCYQVSPRVSMVKNDDAFCAEPVHSIEAPSDIFFLR
jgi:putative SOS response-associated peptidase YedK